MKIFNFKQFNESKIDGLSKNQRIYQRRKNEFDNLSDEEKLKLDAKTVLKLLKDEYPKEEFSICQLYNNEPMMCVFLSDDSRLLSKFNRDKNDGLDNKFSQFLKDNNLGYRWYSKPKEWSYDGIQIFPKNFDFMQMYYGYFDEPVISIKDKNKKEIDNIIKLFKDINIDIYEPDNGLGYNDKSTDRYEFDTIIDNMIFRVEIMKSDPVKSQIKKFLSKTKKTLKRHKNKVVEVYEYCKNISDGELWTLSGGGAQLQQFYGDDNGYLAILYLDMEDESENSKDYARNDCTLVVNGYSNDKKFKNFKSKNNIKIIFSEELYGKE